MASRRNLKKNVNYISDCVAGLCILESMNAQAENKEKARELFFKTTELRKDIISRISHTEPGSVKAFYKKLRNDFNTQIESIFKELEGIR